jgi:hypothetical protein
MKELNKFFENYILISEVFIYIYGINLNKNYNMQSLAFRHP